MILLGAWEWAGLARLNGLRHRLVYGGLVLTLILAFWPWVGNAAFVVGLLGCVLAGWCYALFWMWRYAARPERQENRSATIAVAGVIVLAAPWVAFWRCGTNLDRPMCYSCFCWSGSPISAPISPAAAGAAQAGGHHQPGQDMEGALAPPAWLR